jgi:antitoxin YefM
MISLSDWNAIEESMHLLSNKTNRKRLINAIEQLDGSKGEARDLIEP